VRKVIVYTDGAARGNPGPAGAGVCIRDPRGKLIVECADYIGEATNNVAEYRALILGLEEARRLGAAVIEMRADSELVVRQMLGEYRVRNEALQELHARAKELQRTFEHVEYVHVRREDNRDADRLANRAVDGRRRVFDDERTREREQNTE
jgi:ribonuclease HI